MNDSQDAEQLTAYLDECVDIRVVDMLRNHDVAAITARAAGMSNRGVSDEEQLTFATANGYLIVSTNSKHFHRLHRRHEDEGRSHGGIALLPQGGPPRQLAVRAAMLLAWIQALGDHRSKLYRWGDLQLLMTQGFRPPGFSDEECYLAMGRIS